MRVRGLKMPLLAIFLVRVRIDPRVDLLQRTDAEGELVVVGPPPDPVVVEVVVADHQRQPAEVAIADLLGAPDGRGVATAGSRSAAAGAWRTAQPDAVPLSELAAGWPG